MTGAGHAVLNSPSRIDCTTLDSSSGDKLVQPSKDTKVAAGRFRETRDVQPLASTYVAAGRFRETRDVQPLASNSVTAGRSSETRDGHKLTSTYVAAGRSSETRLLQSLAYTLVAAGMSRETRYGQSLASTYVDAGRFSETRLSQPLASNVRIVDLSNLVNSSKLISLPLISTSFMSSTFPFTTARTYNPLRIVSILQTIASRNHNIITRTKSPAVILLPLPASGLASRGQAYLQRR